jgi:hypothetical protein
MSNTRYSKPGNAPSDERFASDPALCQGVKAGDVIRRCEVLDDPAVIEMILFLQYVSNLPGALKKFTKDLLVTFPERLDAESAQKLDLDLLMKTRGLTPDATLRVFEEIFIESVPNVLRTFCIDPSASVASFNVGFFHDLKGAIIEYMDQWERKTLAPLVITKLGARVIEALDYAEDQKCLALIEGFARTGKTFIAKAWCLARPGRRRFVSLSEATSDKEFYREVAKALGAAASYGLKGNELRERVNDILRPGHLTLVIDEAHFLWPSRNLREASPRRIEWVRSSLANYAVPVAMIATHQFTKAQQQIEKNTNWSSEQLIGRIAFCAKLPDHLEETDIAAVARFHLPNAEDRTIEFLVNYVIASKKHLASIEHGVKAARHEARKAGRDEVTHKDLLTAFTNTVVPSDQNLSQAFAGAKAVRPKRGLLASSRGTNEPISTSGPERDTGGALTVNSDRTNNRSSAASLSTA